MRKSRIALVAATAVVLLSAGYCEPAGLTEGDKTEIHDAAMAALEIVNGSKDWMAYARAYYTEDGIMMAPNAEPAQGIEAIAALFAQMPPFSDLTFETLEIDGTGDMAWVRGRYTVVWMLPGMDPMPDEGSYLEVWKRQADGSWRVAMDAFNSDLPMPE
jgi:ketosteroid isomerase-like protein